MSDDDVVYISGSSAAQQMWHFYHDCHLNLKPCSKCVCYVCDCEASKCTSWLSHVNATASSKWLRQRRANRKKNGDALLPVTESEAVTSNVAEAVVISEDEFQPKLDLNDVQDSNPGSSFATLTSLVSAQDQVQERLLRMMLNTSFPPFKEVDLSGVAHDPVAAASSAAASSAASTSTAYLLKEPSSTTLPEFCPEFMSILNRQSTSSNVSKSTQKITQAEIDAKLKRDTTLSSSHCKVCRRIKGFKHNSSDLHQKSIAYDTLRFLGIDCEVDDILPVVKRLRSVSGPTSRTH